MRIDIEHDQDIISESLKSKFGAKITRNLSKAEKNGFNNKNGMKEYVLQESWFKALKIGLIPTSDVKTAVTFKVHYTNRFQEVLVVLTLGVLILFPQLASFGIYLPGLTFASLLGLILAPGYLIKPLISDIKSQLQEIPKNASHISEKFSSELK